MHAAAAAPHSTVVSQCAAVPRFAAGSQPGSTPQRASTTQPNGEEPATIKKPAGFETLQSSHGRKSLAKARPMRRAASEPEAIASIKESLPTERSAAARPSKNPRLTEFKYVGSHFSDYFPSLRIATIPSADSSVVSAGESISEEQAATPPLPQTFGP